MSIRLFLILSALALLFVVPACTSGNTDNLADLNMTFTDFGVHTGHTFYLKVKSTTGGTLGTITPFAITTPAFSVNVPDVIEEGQTYNIDFWADVDGNATLDASPIGTPAGVDHSWRLTRTGTATGLTVTFVHDTNFTDITPF